MTKIESIDNDLIKHAKRSEGHARIKAMVSLAESHVGVPIEPEHLDRHPWLLNCLNGTIDLKAKALLKHNPEDLLTRMVALNYSPTAQAPRWLSFLDEIFAGNLELTAYVQRVVGYWLSGVANERVFFILFGAGRNGKSTFMQILHHVMGSDYAAKIQAQSLIRRSHERGGPSNDIARLHGMRLAWGSETEEDGALKEATIKEITGNERITARFLFQEYFEFEPQFKLVLLTNSKPRIDGADPAIWDRIELIPFTVRIPDDKVDKSLQETLQAEAEGILAWAVHGCYEWQQKGLAEPQVVSEANCNYHQESDLVGQFIREACRLEQRDSISSLELYEGYTLWCEELGERPLSQKKVSRRLMQHGLNKGGRNAKGRVTWLGIDLNQQLKARMDEKTNAQRARTALSSAERTEAFEG